MARSGRPPFDPTSPAARALVAVKRRCEPTPVVVTAGFLRVAGADGVLHGRKLEPGDRLTVPSDEADQLSALGLASRLPAG